MFRMYKHLNNRDVYAIYSRETHVITYNLDFTGSTQIIFII